MATTGPQPGRGQGPARKVYEECLSLEKAIRQLTAKQGFYAVEARKLREQLRDKYEHLIFSDYQFAVAKEIEPTLWKSVFYRPIEEFRSRIRKEQGAHSDMLAKITTAFVETLEKASQYYKELIRRLQEAYGSVNLTMTELGPRTLPLRPSGSKAAGGVGSVVLDKEVRTSVHRCLIYLGDIGRYLVQIKSGARHDLVQTGRYYREAARVLPDSGNPYNQLAVVAFYCSDELRAVYYYFRSLAIATPFSTARENLLLLFEKNRSKYQNLPRDPAKGFPMLRDEVSTLFVRLAGLLFDRINLDQLPAVKSRAFGALNSLLLLPQTSELLARQPAHDNILLELAIVSIYSIYNLEHRPEGSRQVQYHDAVQLSDLRLDARRVFTEFTVVIVRAVLRMQWTSKAVSAYLCCCRILLRYLALQEEVGPLSSAEDWNLAAHCYEECSKLVDWLGRVAREAKMSFTEPPVSGRLLPEDEEFVAFLPLVPWPSDLAAVKSQQHKQVNNDLVSLQRVHALLVDLKTLAASPGLSEAGQGSKARGEAVAMKARLLKSVQTTFLGLPFEAEPALVEDGAGMSVDDDGPQMAPTASVRTRALGMVGEAGDEEEEEETILLKPKVAPGGTSVSPPSSTKSGPMARTAAVPSPGSAVSSPQQPVGRPKADEVIEREPAGASELTPMDTVVKIPFSSPLSPSQAPTVSMAAGLMAKLTSSIGIFEAPGPLGGPQAPPAISLPEPRASLPVNLRRSVSEDKSIWNPLGPPPAPSPAIMGAMGSRPLGYGQVFGTTSGMLGLRNASGRPDGMLSRFTAMSDARNALHKAAAGGQVPPLLSRSSTPGIPLGDLHPVQSSPLSQLPPPLMPDLSIPSQWPPPLPMNSVLRRPSSQVDFRNLSVPASPSFASNGGAFGQPLSPMFHQGIFLGGVGTHEVVPLDGSTLGGYSGTLQATDLGCDGSDNFLLATQHLPVGGVPSSGPLFSGAPHQQDQALFNEIGMKLGSDMYDDGGRIAQEAVYSVLSPLDDPPAPLLQQSPTMLPPRTGLEPLLSLGSGGFGPQGLVNPLDEAGAYSWQDGVQSQLNGGSRGISTDDPLLDMGFCSVAPGALGLLDGLPGRNSSAMEACRGQTNGMAAHLVNMSGPVGSVLGALEDPLAGAPWLAAAQVPPVPHEQLAWGSPDGDDVIKPPRHTYTTANPFVS